MMRQDAHIHLQDAGQEARRILAEAPAAGIGRFFCNGAAPSDWDSLKSLARDFKSVVPFFGIHPWHIDEARNGWEERLKEFLQNGSSRIGEIGLDKTRRAVNFNEQIRLFRRQLIIASETKKPFTVHCVQAWEALLSELEEHIAGRVPFIVHRFSGSPEAAAELVKAGAYISFSPLVLGVGTEKQRASFSRVPIDRLLLETDYPYIPVAEKARASAAGEYFSTLHSLYAQAAALKAISEDELARKIWDNGTVFVR